MARYRELPDVSADQMRRHNLNWQNASDRMIAELQARGIEHQTPSGYYSDAQIQDSEYKTRMALAPGGLTGGIMSHVDDPADEARYPGYSKWPSFSHPPTPPPWGWRGHPPIWNWEIGWEFEAGFQYDWHMTPPENYQVPGIPEGSTNTPSLPPSASTLPFTPNMEGDPQVIVLPRWQQGLGRYLTPGQEFYDHGVKPIRPVDSWNYGKLNYRLSAQRAMGRIT